MFLAVSLNHVQNLLEESVVRPDTETQHGPGMLTTEEIQGLFGPANESALHRLRHVLAFLRSLDPVDGNFGCLPGSMLAKVAFLTLVPVVKSQAESLCILDRFGLTISRCANSRRAITHTLQIGRAHV